MKADKKAALQTQIATLERQLFAARAMFASTLGKAFDDIPNASTEKFMGSGVIIEISSVEGKLVIPATMIRDGLSAATIKAIQNDLRRSFELATMVNPAMAHQER